MQKNKNSKKKRIEHLRMVLDNPDNKYLHPEDEKYLRILSKRLKEASEKKISSKQNKTYIDRETEIDLTPRVTIYAREEKTITKTELPTHKKEKQIIKEKEEIKIEDEDIFEIEKTEKPIPRFIEVKPKETVRRKKTKHKKKAEKTEELLEWEPVEEIPAPPGEEKEKIKTLAEEEQPSIYCSKCGASIEKDFKFCPECGFNLTEPEEQEISEEEKQKIINTFKELKHIIDEKTAIQLYNHGYKSPDDLKNTTYKELTKIKGIKKKTAKQIIKEIQKLQEKEKKQKTKIEPIEDKLLLTEKQIKEEKKKEETIEKTPEETVFKEVEEIREKPKKDKKIQLFKKEKIETEEETFIEDIQEKTIYDENKINALKKLESIDEKTAKILIDNGITSIKELKNKTLKDLKKIKGIKKKTAKQIIKEIQKLQEKEKKQKTKIEPIEDKLLLTEKQIKEEKKKEETTIKKQTTEPKEITAIPIEETAQIEITPEQIQQEKTEEKQKIINTFKELKHIIDEKTAIQLYNHGYKSPDDLKNTTYKELTKIKGIKKKTAKQIIKEIKEKTQVDQKEIDEQIKNEAINEMSNGDIVLKFEEKQEKITPIPIEETAQIEITPEQIQQEKTEEKQKIINTFKELKHIIDEKTAKILIDNGITSIKELKNKTLKDLKKIKGIKKKTAKQIIKEIQKLQEKEKKQKTKIEPIEDKLLLTEKQIKEELVEEEEFEEIEGPVELENSYWTPIKEEAPLKKKKTEKKTKKKEKQPDTDAFKELKHIIDEKTAKILIDNGITSIKELKNKTLKDLKKIKGIKKKTAENIFKEINKKDEKNEENTDFITDDEEAVEFITEEEFKELEDKILNHTENENIRKNQNTVFKDIKSIDEETAELLIENGIDSVDILKTKAVRDLVKIKGIKKKTAKQIIKELEELDSSGNDKVFYIHKKENKDDDFPGFRYGEYMLFEKEIYTVSNKKRIVRFFSKQKPDGGIPINLPEGYEVREDGNGIPYLKKI